MVNFKMFEEMQRQAEAVRQLMDSSPIRDALQAFDQSGMAETIASVQKSGILNHAQEMARSAQLTLDQSDAVAEMARQAEESRRAVGEMINAVQPTRTVLDAISSAIASQRDQLDATVRQLAEIGQIPNIEEVSRATRTAEQLQRSMKAVLPALDVSTALAGIDSVLNRELAATFDQVGASIQEQLNATFNRIDWRIGEEIAASFAAPSPLSPPTRPRNPTAEAIAAEREALRARLAAEMQEEAERLRADLKAQTEEMLQQVRADARAVFQAELLRQAEQARAEAKAAGKRGADLRRRVAAHCVVCQTKFIGTARRRYCSDTCRLAAFAARRARNTNPATQDDTSAQNSAEPTDA